MTDAPESLTQIVQILSRHPEGLNINDVANKLALNRNTVAKYLEILHQQGQVDIRHIGKSKLFTVSKRIPFSILTEISSDYIIGVDRDLNCIAANTRFYEWVSYKPKELLGKHISNLSIPLFEHPEIVDLIRDCLSSIKEPITVSCTLHNKDCIYEIRGVPVIFANSATGSAVKIRDVTKRETADTEISLLKEKYQAVAEVQSEYIVHSLPDGAITYANPAFAAVAGVPVERLIGKRFHLKIPEDELVQVRQHFQSIRRDDPKKSIEHRVLTHSGDIRWIRWTNRGIFRNETLAEYHSHGIDITELKTIRNQLQFYHENTEKMIREKTEEFQKINRELLAEIQKRKQIEQNLQKTQFCINNSSELILWTDETGTIISLNKSALDTLGAPLGSIPLFMRPGISGPHQPVLWQDIKKFAKQNGYYLFEAIMQDRNDIPHHMEVGCAYLYYGDIESYVLFFRDISSRKKAEEALRHSEEKFRNIFNSVNDAIDIHEIDDRGPSGKFIEVNDVACSRLQYSREELLTMSPLDLLTQPSSISLDQIENDLQTKGYAFFETEFIRKDGTILPVEINAHVVSLGKKRVVVSVIRDITERKLVENALIAKEQNYRTLVENSPDLIVRYDTNLRRIYVNPAWEEVTGLPAREIINVPVTDTPVVPVPVAKEYLAKLMNVLEMGTVQEIEFSWVNTKGVTLYCYYVVVPEFDPQGKVMSMLGIGHDITGQKQAEETLRQSERKLHTLVDNIPDCITRFDADGRYIYVNPATEKTFGIQAGEIIGMTLRESGKPGDDTQNTELERVIRQVFDEGKVIRSEFEWVTASGTRVYDVLHIPEKDEMGDVRSVIGIAHDITDRKAAEQELRLSEEKYRLVVENSYNPIYIYRDTRLLFANARVSELTGYSHDELMAMNVWTFIHPDDRERLHESAQNRLSGKEAPLHFRSRIIRKNGGIRDCEFFVNLIMYQGQESIIGIIQDITEHKRGCG
jgi:PAS domain S-box-containing protein